MADICSAINAVLEAEGYGEYCRSPHIRRRGRGVGAIGAVLRQCLINIIAAGNKIRSAGRTRR
jgi:hypothetical protein